jgi:uncharacterized membrane protein YfcA
MLLAAAATLAGAAVQSATGFGFALLASPALFAVLDPYEAVSALLALGLALNLLVLADRGGRVRWRPLTPLLLAAIPGLGLGVLVLELLPKAALQLGVGLGVVAAALVQLRTSRPPAADAARPARPAAREPGRPPAAGAGLAGLASGALTTSISISGPPIVLWLERRGTPPGEFRASLAASFLALNLAGWVVVLVAGGAGQTAEPSVLLPLLGLVVAGHLAGAVAFRRLDSRSFRLAVVALVLAAGAASAVAGAVAL